MKKTALFMLWQLSIVVGILVILSLIGVKTVEWLHTENGQKFVTKRIAAQLEGKGVRLDKLTYTYISTGLYEVQATGIVQEHPFTAKAHIKPQKFKIDIENITTNLPELKVNGALSYSYGNSFVTGTLIGTLNSLNPYQTGHDLSPLGFTVNLQSDNKILITANTAEYNKKESNIALRDIAFKGMFQNDVLTIDALTVNDHKEGTFSLYGTIDAKAQNVDIKAIIKNFSPNIIYTKGRVNADIHFHGKPEDFKLTGEINPQKVTITVPDEFEAAPQYTKKEEKDENTALEFAKTVKLDLKINAPKQIYLQGQGLDIELSAKLRIKGFANDPKVVGQLKTIRGTLSELNKDPVTGRLTKATSDPRPISFEIDAQANNKIIITANISGYNNKKANIALRDIAFNAVFQNNILTINTLTLKDDKEGTASVSGIIDAASKKVDVKTTIKNFSPNIPYTKGKINADIQLYGVSENYKLTGQVNPQKMTITLPDQFETAVRQVNIVRKGEKPAADFTKTLALDLKINAPKQIYVLGMGLDAEFGGTLKATGFADDPQVEGTLKIIRGRFSEFGKNFDITKATLAFYGSIPPSPELDITTETKAGEITAQILIKGPAQKPEISFASIPERPEDEIVSQILFGKDPTNLSPIQAIQLARSVAKFSGVIKGGGFDPIVSLRNATGLDDISVDTDEEGNVSVGAKKRITEKVTLQVESGAEPGSTGAKIEIELTPSITLESKIDQDASGGAGIFWKRDY